MRTQLACDFFLGDEDPDGGDGQEWLKVFPGPRSIVIADAQVCLDTGVRVRHGEAFATRNGLEFVYHSAHEGAGGERCTLAMRFVVKDATYDPSLDYVIRQVRREPG